MERLPRYSRAHLSLGQDFFDPVAPAEFPSHKLRYRNDTAAGSVGLAHLNDAQWISHFAKFTSLDPLAQPAPLALRYHGHQFQQYNPDLGDGRGFLFAQLYDLDDGRLLDLGTKGSGTTPYSRSGDGRLTLKGAVREALATGFLELLGVNTSKTLSIIETGEQLFRNDEPSPTRSAVLVRLSHSHIRFGTFQRLSFEGKTEAVAQLIDHCFKYYFSDISENQIQQSTALSFLNAVVSQKAKTVAQWMAAGFVHGVLNTDNMNITGESFDYGPYRFLPYYDPGFTAAYFDHAGLYAFGRQPSAVLWNLRQLAGTLTPFADHTALMDILQGYGPKLESEIAYAVFRRFGVQAPVTEDNCLDLERANEILTVFYQAMRKTSCQYQAPFFDLYGGGTEQLKLAQTGPRSQYYQNHTLAAALAPIVDLPSSDTARKYQRRLDDDVPDLRLPEIEAIWNSIAQGDDWRAFQNTLNSFELAPLAPNATE